MRHLILVCALIIGTAATAQDMRSVTDDTGFTMEIPVTPQRIVSGHNLPVTLPLIELGVVPAGSHGRGETLDNAFIRGSAALTGVDFDNSEIQWMGNYPIDIELVAAIQPDLIITTTWQPADVDQLRAIAPTFVIDFTTCDEWSVFDLLADLTGAGGSLDLLKRRYAVQLDAIIAEVETANLTVSTIHAHDDALFAYNPYGTIGKILIDAGIDRPDMIEAIPVNDSAEFTAEVLPEFDGDFIITTFRSSGDETPDTVRSYFEAQVPGYCNLLHACREGQMYFLSRAEAASPSYAALIMTAYTLRTILGGVDFTPMPE